MKWVGILFVCAVLSTFATAQNASAIQTAEPSCGPANVNFKVNKSDDRHPTQPPSSGSARIYVIEDVFKPGNEFGTPTIRVGVDGSWMGADHGNSYFFFPVTPGEHHLCINWQSRLKRFSRLVSFSNLTAQRDQTYYFRAKVEIGTETEGPYILDLETLNPDEARFLISTYPNVSSIAKK